MGKQSTPHSVLSLAAAQGSLSGSTGSLEEVTFLGPHLRVLSEPLCGDVQEAGHRDEDFQGKFAIRSPFEVEKSRL